MRRTSFVLAVLALVPCFAAQAAPQNVYEWSAVAPVVVAGESLGRDGRYVDFRVERVFRGELEPGDLLRVDIRTTNRDRNRNLDPHALNLYEGERFLLLLKPGPREPKGATTYILSRGVDGARAVPAEGAELLYDALARFVENQDLKEDNLIWVGMEGLLETTNPIVLQAALEQFQKFRRGEPELLLTLRPLLDHPESDIREDAARLIGQIVQRNLSGEIPEEASLRGELIGAARRDPVPSVRVWATWSLGRFPDSSAEAVLEEISESDPEQEVRYAAAKILSDRRSNTSSEQFD
jgi:hypothetical protein